MKDNSFSPSILISVRKLGNACARECKHTPISIRGCFDYVEMLFEPAGGVMMRRPCALLSQI